MNLWLIMAPACWIVQICEMKHAVPGAQGLGGSEHVAGGTC